MKFLKIFLIIVVSLVAIVLIGSLFLPKTYMVKRSIFIKAPDSVVYNNTSNFTRFLKWNPWSKMEPSAKVTVSGTASQPGHLYQWNGKETGEGQMLLKATKPNSLVDIELKFLKPFESTADTKFLLAADNGGTNVTWAMSGENKTVMEKWMGLAMDKMIGKDFEDGLRDLKAFSEKP
ncbi:MAG: hypothetical protein K0S09_2551 [Sphingobacteriaceae bacterium]|jgi:hypothetical protein|nr:hypothetical protein [Sphingobacteriaceae bacterium]